MPLTTYVSESLVYAVECMSLKVSKWIPKVFTHFLRKLYNPTSSVLQMKQNIDYIHNNLWIDNIACNSWSGIVFCQFWDDKMMRKRRIIFSWVSHKNDIYCLKSFAYPHINVLFNHHLFIEGLSLDFKSLLTLAFPPYSNIFCSGDQFLEEYYEFLDSKSWNQYVCIIYHCR